METVNIAQQLKHMRKSAGYTQEQVSRILNLTRSAYANYEAGKRTPSLDCIIQLANFYSTSVDFILGVDLHVETAATKERSNISVTNDEFLLLELYRSLSCEHQKEFLEYGRYRKALSKDTTIL